MITLITKLPEEPGFQERQSRSGWDKYKTNIFLGLIRIDGLCVAEN